ncbi:TPA: hypothetical protein ACX0A7_005059 [Salmonella enterica]
MALTGYLAPAYQHPVMPVHGLAQLTRMLQAYPRMPVLLGLRPHEHVVDLYRLRPLLAGRAVLFVGRCFYWTDYNLPEWLALERYGFCTWDAMQDPFSRRMELRRFSRLCVDVKDEGDDRGASCDSSYDRDAGAGKGEPVAVPGAVGDRPDRV